MEGFGRHLMTEAYVSYCVLALASMHGGGDHCVALLEQVGAGLARIAAALIEDEDYAVTSVRTKAADRGKGFLLSGAKVHVEDGADADWFLISARTAGGTGDRDGISLFLVPHDAEGLRVQHFRSVDSHRHCRIDLADVVGIPVGAIGEAAERIEAAIDRTIVAHLSDSNFSIPRQRTKIGHILKSM